MAEAANPEFVSVPLIGWSLADALRRATDVHLVTQIRNREALLRAGLIEGKDFTAIDSEKLAAPMWKLGQLLRMGDDKGWTMLQALSTLSYPYFERLVWQAFGARIRGGEFDLVHRITPLSPSAQSWIAPRIKAAGVPFVIGPLNGGVPWPRGFEKEKQQEGEWLSRFRDIYKLMPSRRRTLEASAAILVGSRRAESEIPPPYRARCIYIPENAVDPARFNLRAAPAGTGPLRIGFVGRLVPCKGTDMLVEAALPLLKSGKASIDFVGDGPMMATLQAQVHEAGVTDAVTFHGWKSHADVQQILAGCALLGFPSIREFGGGAVLEAMALGVAPLVVDYAGPGELVGPRTGFKVPLGSRAEIVAHLTEALTRIEADRPGLAAAAAAARACIESHFTWDRRAEQMLEIYDWVLGRRADKPAPFGL